LCSVIAPLASTRPRNFSTGSLEEFLAAASKGSPSAGAGGSDIKPLDVPADSNHQPGEAAVHDNDNASRFR
jgi:hypothetical protein